MTPKSKKDIRNKLLDSLRDWHAEIGILDFPKRFGISTNEKKFREISFRIRNDIHPDEAQIDDVVANFQTIYGMGNTIVGYTITYRVWLPKVDRKEEGYWTIRFNLHPSVVALVKVEDFFMVVEHDYFPLQRKCIGLPRMFGVTPSGDLKTVADLILVKEYPFLMDNMKSFEVKQLGNIVYQDPSSRYERTLNLFIDIKLQQPVKTKEELSMYVDPRNHELLLHHIFIEEELKNVYQNSVKIIEEKELTQEHRKEFIDQYSLWALGVYFANR